MVAMQSCDHHDRDRCVPSTRSRARILEQFEAAIRLGAAFRELALGKILDVSLIGPRGLLDRPTITLDAESFLAAWRASMAWHAVAPRGDDLVPPFPPSEIVVGSDEAEPVAPEPVAEEAAE